MCLAVLYVFRLWHTKLSGTDGYLTARALSNSAPDSQTDAASSLRALGPEDQTALDTRAALAQEKCGPDRRAPDRAPARSDAPPSAPAAPPSAPAAQSGPAAARSLRADCDLGYLLTGVFSAPASGVFVRRPAASAGG